MLIAIFIIGFLFLALIVKIAKGAVKLLLILILLILIAGSSLLTHNNSESLPVSTNL